MYMKKRYNFTLSQESVEILKGYSTISGIKMTTILEKLIIKYLKNKKYEDV